MVKINRIILIDNNLQQLYCKRPHVVIVGAGASRAVMGNQCPTMADAVDVIGLDSILKGVELETASRNIEAIYGELFNREKECEQVRQSLEIALHNYFSKVKLPDEITIYDLLLLSLTKKDCVASFNWDSLLIQAYNRVTEITSNLPRLFFLHGNVGAGFCEPCKRFGPIQNYCPICGQPFTPTPLLYPVEKKDYNSNIFIKDQWNASKDFISRAGKVTIFGYSAPSSDKAASDILKSAFSKFDNIHRFDTVEVIERPDYDSSEISETWKYFFSKTNYHYNITGSFFKSSLAEAPRRTIQYQHRQFIEGWWGQPSIAFTENHSFESVKEMLQPLFEDEIKGTLSVI